MDPATTPEVYAAMQGIHLQRPHGSGDNHFVREMVDEVHRFSVFRTGDAVNQPRIAYAPGDADPATVLPTGLRTGHVRANPFFLEELANVHHLQQNNIIQRQKRFVYGWTSDDKGKGKGKGKPPPPVAVHRFDGADDTCSICQEPFIRAQDLFRLTCNHQFHQGCWNGYLVSNIDNIECPNCRGPPHVKALFKYVGRAKARAKSNRASGESSTESFHSAFMINSRTEPTASDMARWASSWSFLEPEAFLAAEATEAGVRGNADPPQEIQQVHLKQPSRLELPSGEISMVVDLGSWINIIGINNATRFSELARQHDLETVTHRRAKMLSVSGVGSDSAICKNEASIPIAVQFEDSPATHETFQANVAEGCGSDLPAILGTKSMKEKDSVIILRNGKEMIVFPGPGGYKIEWSPGTKLLPITTAPSGHLLIPCGKFARLPKGTKKPVSEVFFTDHLKTVETDS